MSDESLNDTAPPEEGGRAGYVYFFVTEADQFVKIGMSSSVDKRYQTIQTACPLRIERTFYIACSDRRAVELSLHRFFSSARSYGEWFRPAEDAELALLLDLIERGDISTGDDITLFLERMTRNRQLFGQIMGVFEMPPLEDAGPEDIATVAAMKLACPEWFDLWWPRFRRE